MKVGFIGNCQTKALAGVYVRFVYPYVGGEVRDIDAYGRLSDQDRQFIKNVDLLIIQKASMATSVRWDELPTRGRIHIVPVVTGEFLWPYAGKARINDPSAKSIHPDVWPPDISDDYINRLIMTGTTADAAIRSYLNLDPVRDMKLDRRFELAMDGLRRREEGTAYRAADIIEAHFRSESLFTTPGHPGLRLSRYMALTFLSEIDAEPKSIERATKYLTAPTYPTIELPIHPTVSSYFGLNYGKPNQRYQFHQEGRLTFEEYIRQYIDGSYDLDLFYGMRYFWNGEFRAAYDSLRLALRHTPASAGCHAALAEISLRDGDTHAALSFALKAARLEPRVRDHQELLARIYATTRNFSMARRSLQTTIMMGAEPGLGYRKVATIAADIGCHSEGLQILQESAGLDPLDPITPLLASKLYLSLGNQPASQEALKAAVKLAPNNAGYHRELALALLKDNQLEEALHAIRTAVALAPHSAICVGLLGDILMRIGIASEGEALLRRAVSMAPNDAALHRQLAHWLRENRNFDEAIPYMRQCVELAPENSENTIIFAHMLAQSLPHNVFHVYHRFASLRVIS